MNQQKYMDAAKQFVKISVEEFKDSHKESDLDVKTLKPTYPTSLEKVSLEGKQMSQINLDPVVLSAICGTIFGDSSLAINKGYSNARLQMRHSTRQTEWFMWKSLCILKEFIEDTQDKALGESICFQKPDGYQRKAEAFGGETLGKWKILTKVNPELTKLHSIIIQNNKKTLKRSWLNHMNNYFLMVLWLDDGSLNGARQGVISLNNTPLDQAQVLVQYISSVWGVKCEAKIVKSKITSTNLEPVAITISDLQNLEKFLKIIAPIIPVKSMIYKVCIYYEDRSRLQRWTSDLKSLIRDEWHPYLDKYYAYLGAIQIK